MRPCLREKSTKPSEQRLERRKKRGGGKKSARGDEKGGRKRHLFVFFPLQSHFEAAEKKKKTGWTDKQNRPGIDPVDEACHAHDTCYGQAREANPPSHKVRRAAAECACDRALVSALKDFKKNKQQQAAASKAAKRAAGDMEKLFDVKCPLAVAGAVLRPPSPSPESAPGGNW